MILYIMYMVVENVRWGRGKEEQIILRRRLKTAILESTQSEGTW